MTYAPGARVGPYEIVAPLGAGGMGEVYKARDTRLDRFVAIKTIRVDRAASTDARERFEREARAISRLSHPHICALHDVGHDGGIEYLVMELLDGETLAHRVAKGPLPVAQVLRIGREIAEALAAAHREGIVHRDLKPGNVMLTSAGVKLLDFGLAKAIAPAPADDAAGEAMTAAGALTETGMWVGTAPYMAPEQIQEQRADARSDVFALGAVLYEMATGQRAFAGRSAAESISAVLHHEPAPIAAGTVPASFERLVRECLDKNPMRRWQSAHDVALQLEAIGAPGQPASAAAPAAHGRSRTAMLGWTVAVVALGGALAAWWPGARAETPARERVELQLMPPAGVAFAYSAETVTFALSPDGARLAFIASSDDGIRRVWMRSPASIVATPVTGTEAADSVFWSPDGASIAFFASGALKRLDLRTGAAVPVCTVQKSIGLTGTWGASGRILFASVEGGAIYAVPTAGGTPTVEVSPDATRGERRVQFPSFLPDGTRYLYLLRTRDGAGSIMLGETGRPARRIMPAESNAAYLDSGDLVFAQGGTLVSRPFDPATATISGEPLALAESVRFFLTTGVAAFSVSRSGTLVYQSQRNRARLAWVDRAGHEIRSVGTPGDYLDMRLSPSGQTALLSRALPATGTFDVWTLDLQRDASTRITLTDALTEFGPAMTPDGQSLLFSAPQGGSPRIVRKMLGTGAEAALMPGTQFQTVDDISPDGRLLAFSQRQNSGVFNLWMMPLAGPPAPVPFRTSDFSEGGLRFSPDGRLVSFISRSSGRGEVYVAPAAGGPATLVSSGAVVMAVWSRDGREVLYLSTDRRLVSVPVLRTAPVPQFGAPVTLFAWSGRPWICFDVAQDGRSVLALIPDIVANEQPLTALLHWRETIRR